jgi:hypothetical protein
MAAFAVPDAPGDEFDLAVDPSASVRDAGR